MRKFLLLIFVVTIINGCSSSSSSDNSSSGDAGGINTTDLIGNYILRTLTDKTNALTATFPVGCDDPLAWCVTIDEQTDAGWRGSSNRAQHVFGTMDPAVSSSFFLDFDWFTGTAQGPIFFIHINGDGSITGYGCFSEFGDSDCEDLAPGSSKYESGMWS